MNVIPQFNSIQEAQAYGKRATDIQIIQLTILKDYYTYEGKIQLKTDNLDEALTFATKAQFMNEALTIATNNQIMNEALKALGTIINS